MCATDQMQSFVDPNIRRPLDLVEIVLLSSRIVPLKSYPSTGGIHMQVYITVIISTQIS